MKNILRKLGRILRGILCLVIIFLIGTTIYHHAMLKVVEAGKIVPNGTMVEVNGHKMHVYAEGAKSDKPTLVFMSGSGTVAPVYDFKSLYSKLSYKYHIVVVEKAGYGYSDIFDISRDIETMLSETRQALLLAGEKGPYVLLPHSMSGIEAIYWSQKYPEEVKGIIGLDMAVPESYDCFDFKTTGRLIQIGKASAWLGVIRTIPGIYPLNTEALTSQEIQQQKYLMYRNAVNLDYVLEGKTVYNNAKIVSENKLPGIPILLFVSDGKGIGDYWIPCQERFAKSVNGEIVYLSCSHYVYYYESDLIAERSRKFIDAIH